MPITSPFSKDGRLIDNANRIAKILYRVDAYRKIFSHAVSNGVPIKDMLITQFPFLFRDHPYPPTISVELTNYCDLKCVYCSSPLGLRPRGYMSDETFEHLLSSVKESKTARLRIVGNGEATLHPRFSEFMSELAKHVKFLSIVTNGQWKREKIGMSLLEAPFNVIEISIDGVNAEEYESSRVGGNYDRLISNLKALKTAKQQMRSKTQVNIRLMMRPSQIDYQQKYMTFWKEYADSVMPQYITQIKDTEYNTDVFISQHNVNSSIPKCSLIFKNVEVKWTGQVLLCGLSFYQHGDGGLELGNINEESLTSLWNCHIMRTFRHGHRHRKEEHISMCRGCQGY